jgi:hypothetical protein
MRMHGTIAARPLEVFNELEASVGAGSRATRLDGDVPTLDGVTVTDMAAYLDAPTTAEELAVRNRPQIPV